MLRSFKNLHGGGVYFKAEQKQSRPAGYWTGGGQAGSNSISPAAPIKLVMLNKLGGNEGAYLFFNNLGGSVVFFFTIFDSPRKEFLVALIYSEQSDEEFSKRK